MAVNLTNADSALKSYYLDAVSNQLDNKTDPFLAAIKKTTENVWGKDVKKLAIHGVNGGIGAGTEDGDLPAAKGNRYTQFTSTLKNLYGSIEISDKALRASENNSGAFVSLLNAEMDGLLKSSSFNLGRMLFGDGSGIIGYVSEVSDGEIYLDNVINFIEGMVVDFRTSAGVIIEGATEREVLFVDRTENMIKVSGTALTENDLSEGYIITIHGSYQNEITGLKAVFSNVVPTLYGVTKANNPWMTPYVKSSIGNLKELDIQKALDAVEEKGGNPANMIITSWGVRRSLINLFSTNKRNIDTMELAGGFKALSYNGIPIVVDRFCPKYTMYILNTDDFALHQLCDWQWIEGDDGKILRQVPGKPVYSATLVKYAELMCDKPYAQAVLCNIVES